MSGYELPAISKWHNVGKQLKPKIRRKLKRKNSSLKALLNKVIKMNIVEQYNQHLSLPIQERLKIKKPFTDNEMAEIYKLEIIRQIEENLESGNKKNIEYLLKNVKKNYTSPEDPHIKTYDNPELLKEVCLEIITSYDSLYQKLNLK
ncbi:hypothetical protein [Flavobacterium sp. GSP27]|uniref:hypothetical protein n=1 Tax=Flavobacterium sp. GSP27 TaxID=2497489 RepID=UPI0018F6625D|nr:hypothetical protein [Flavobacterium sp. GSP27]